MNRFQMKPNIIEVIPNAIHTSVEWGRNEIRFLTAADALAHDYLVLLLLRIWCIARVQYYIMGLRKFPIMK